MRESIFTAAHRVTYQQRHGPARTLRDMLAHELGRCIPGTSYRSGLRPSSCDTMPITRLCLAEWPKCRTESQLQGRPNHQAVVGEVRPLRMGSAASVWVVTLRKVVDGCATRQGANHLTSPINTEGGT